MVRRRKFRGFQARPNGSHTSLEFFSKRYTVHFFWVEKNPANRNLGGQLFIFASGKRQKFRDLFLLLLDILCCMILNLVDIRNAVYKLNKDENPKLILIM